MLIKSSLKTEYSRLYPAIAEEEPEEEASPTSTSPTDMTAAFQEFMTAEKRAAPTPSSDLRSKKVELLFFSSKQLYFYFWHTTFQSKYIG